MKRFKDKNNSIENKYGKKISKFALILGLLIVVTVILSGAASAAYPLASTPQPKIHHDNQNTGQSQYTGPQTNHTKWKYKTDDWITSSPAIGKDGTIYVGCWDHNIYAMTPDGAVKWRYYTEGNILSSAAINTKGTIYIQGDLYLYAMNPNGTVKWKYLTNGGISSPAIGSDGTVYVGSDGDNTFYAINPTGTLKWKYHTSEWILSSPAIGKDGTIYFGCYDHKLYAFNPNGTLKWKFTTGDNIEASPTIGSDGIIYVASDDNKLYAINPNGNQKWAYTTGNPIGSPAIGKDGTLYFGCGNTLCALNPNKTLKWKYSLPDSSISEPTIGSDCTIYIGSGYKIYAVKPDGTLKWKYGDIGPNSPLVIGSNGTLYFGSWDGNLYALQDLKVTASLTSGFYNKNQYVTIKSNYLSQIYYTTNGKTPTKSSSIYTNPLLITKSTILKFFAVDAQGYTSPIYTKSYVIDKLAPVIKATIPITGYTHYSTTAMIKIKFNENIKASTLYNYITVKKISTNTKVQISKAIVGNTLYIKTNNKRSLNTYYRVTIPAWAVEDKTGNKLHNQKTIVFKTI